MLSIDLFAGCGGLSKGLKDAGFKCLWANEFDKDAANTFRMNFPSAIVSEEDIRDINANSLRLSLGITPNQLDLLAGGFPCQGFSTYGKRHHGDERNFLYLDFIRFAEEFRPKRILIENVVGILSMSNGAVVGDIRHRIENLGYRTDVVTLQSAEYGVPQLRKRVFISGTLPGHEFEWPERTHTDSKKNYGQNQDLERYVTVGEAIFDLPAEVLKPNQAHDALEYPSRRGSSAYAREMRQGSAKLLDHSAKQLMSIRKLRIILMQQGGYGASLSDLDLSMEIPASIKTEIIEDCGLRRPLHLCRKQDQQKERALREIISKDDLTYSDLIDFIGSGGFANKYRRLDANRPSHTLVAHMARDCSDFIHPTKNRFISVREAARLQSFPDNFKFTGSQFAQLKQIGNAVPPLLARAVGLSILAQTNLPSRALAAE